MTRNNLKAAQKRLDIITKEHIPQLPTHEPEHLSLPFNWLKRKIIRIGITRTNGTWTKIS